MALKLDIEAEEKDGLVHGDEDNYKDKRQTARSYPVVELPIYDVDDPTVEGVVTDLSAKGVQIVGIPSKEGQRKTFFIQANEFGAGTPFSFEAECRWVREDRDTGRVLAGFEILGISDKDLQQLRMVMNLLTFSD
jgi:hypothetical protein